MHKNITLHILLLTFSYINLQCPDNGYLQAEITQHEISNCPGCSEWGCIACNPLDDKDMSFDMPPETLYTTSKRIRLLEIMEEENRKKEEHRRIFSLHLLKQKQLAHLKQLLSNAEKVHRDAINTKAVISSELLEATSQEIVNRQDLEKEAKELNQHLLAQELSEHKALIRKKKERLAHLKQLLSNAETVHRDAINTEATISTKLLEVASQEIINRQDLEKEAKELNQQLLAQKLSENKALIKKQKKERLARLKQLLSNAETVHRDAINTEEAISTKWLEATSQELEERQTIETEQLATQTLLVKQSFPILRLKQILPKDKITVLVEKEIVNEIEELVTHAHDIQQLLAPNSILTDIQKYSLIIASCKVQEFLMREILQRFAIDKSQLPQADSSTIETIESLSDFNVFTTMSKLLNKIDQSFDQGLYLVWNPGSEFLQENAWLILLLNNKEFTDALILEEQNRLDFLNKLESTCLSQIDAITTISSRIQQLLANHEADLLLKSTNVSVDQKIGLILSNPFARSILAKKIDKAKLITKQGFDITNIFTLPASAEFSYLYPMLEAIGDSDTYLETLTKLSEKILFTTLKPLVILNPNLISLATEFSRHTSINDQQVFTSTFLQKVADIKNIALITPQDFQNIFLIKSLAETIKALNITKSIMEKQAATTLDSDGIRKIATTLKILLTADNPNFLTKQDTDVILTAWLQANKALGINANGQEIFNPAALCKSGFFYHDTNLYEIPFLAGITTLAQQKFPINELPTESQAKTNFEIIAKERALQTHKLLMNSEEFFFLRFNKRASSLPTVYRKLLCWLKVKKQYLNTTTKTLSSETIKKSSLLEIVDMSTIGANKYFEDSGGGPNSCFILIPKLIEIIKDPQKFIELFSAYDTARYLVYPDYIDTNNVSSRLLTVENDFDIYMVITELLTGNIFHIIKAIYTIASTGCDPNKIRALRIAMSHPLSRFSFQEILKAYRIIKESDDESQLVLVTTAKATSKQKNKHKQQNSKTNEQDFKNALMILLEYLGQGLIDGSFNTTAFEVETFPEMAHPYFKRLAIDYARCKRTEPKT